ncbi:MAG: glycosyltransferase family A protein [Bacteroidales bacterium]
MGFASAWLEESAIFPRFIEEAPQNGTGIIIVVPSYNEPGITRLIDSLSLCDEPDCKVEVIIVINAPADADAVCRENNRKTGINLEIWRKTHSVYFRLYIIDVTGCAVDGWGVGLARKTGMDEAARRFNQTDRPDGVILNLDADCTVDRNYLTAVTDELLIRKDRSACSIYFEHPLSGNEFPEVTYDSIVLYELHLRYYLQGLAWSGFPWVHHTVGSAIAVRALAYVKAGGMNRRQAGEDFYFIQKLVPAGGYFNLNLTVVHPSPRSSFRVPFGTGATISRLTGTGKILLTYNILAFRELKVFFSLIDAIFRCSANDLEHLYLSLPAGIKDFIPETEWTLKILEIKRNTKGVDSFRKRFFYWFNMFRIVKYLNKLHESRFEKKPVPESASELLRELGSDPVADDPVSLLLYYRKLEKPF